MINEFRVGKGGEEKLGSRLWERIKRQYMTTRERSEYTCPRAIAAAASPIRPPFLA